MSRPPYHDDLKRPRLALCRDRICKRIQFIVAMSYSDKCIAFGNASEQVDGKIYGLNPKISDSDSDHMEWNSTKSSAQWRTFAANAHSPGITKHVENWHYLILTIIHQIYVDAQYFRVAPRIWERGFLEFLRQNPEWAFCQIMNAQSLTSIKEKI